MMRLSICLFTLLTLLLANTSEAKANPLLNIHKDTNLLSIVEANAAPTMLLEPKQSLEYKRPERPPVPGNTYYKCQCTYYAKMMRPDIPNHLGNADRWYQNLKSMDWYVGDIPIKGSVAQFKSYMHVAYVEDVRGDSIYVSEWNYRGPCVKTFRWVSAEEVYFIY